MNRRFSSRLASILLVLHGLIEIAGPIFINSISLALISFGGLTGPALERNASAIAMFGVFWGIARLIAAWSLHKWAMVLGMILSSVTLAASITIIPAGVTDTLFARCPCSDPITVCMVWERKNGSPALTNAY